MEKIFFIMFAFAAIGSAVAVITMRNPVHSALALMTCLLQVAALFVLLRAPFLAAVQVFIYIGAIMVLFLFVVMVLDVRKVVMESFDIKNRLVVIGALVLITIEMVFIALTGPFGSVENLVKEESTIKELGMELFTKFLFPFEVISVLLLVAMVGAILMAREKAD